MTPIADPMPIPAAAPGDSPELDVDVDAVAVAVAGVDVDVRTAADEVEPLAVVLVETADYINGFYSSQFPHHQLIGNPLGRLTVELILIPIAFIARSVSRYSVAILSVVWYVVVSESSSSVLVTVYSVAVDPSLSKINQVNVMDVSAVHCDAQNNVFDSIDTVPELNLYALPKPILWLVPT